MELREFGYQIKKEKREKKEKNMQVIHLAVTKSPNISTASLIDSNFPQFMNWAKTSYPCFHRLQPLLHSPPPISSTDQSQLLWSSPFENADQVRGWYCYVVLFLVMYIAGFCRASVAAQAAFLSISIGLFTATGRCEMLLNGCGPELVDQSERLHELGEFRVGWHFFPADPTKCYFSPIFFPYPNPFPRV